MANSSSVKVAVKGIDQLRAVLKALPEEVRQNVLTSMLDEGCKPIEKIARTLAVRRTGALRKSITHLVRKYPSTNTAIGVIGPDRGFYNSGKRLKKGADRRNADRPANYAHLVEFGHVNRDGSFTAARPFMRPAALTGEQASADAMAIGAEKGLEKARKKYFKGVEGKSKA